MTKRCYIGVNNVARKVKKGYVGVAVDEPVYEEGEPVTTLITSANISSFFTVNNGSYYFNGNGSVFTTNNGGVNSSTATTKLTAKQDMQLSFNYSYSSEANYDKFSLTIAGTVIENGVSGATTNKSWSGQLSKGQVISFAYQKDSSQQANDDKCTFSGMQVTVPELVQTGTVQKKVARKIKKAYMGVGGVARPCWRGGTLSSYGTITSLSSSRYEMGATTVGNYAILAGGGYSTGTDIVDVYNMSLSRQTITPLSSGRYAMGAATWGDCAIFGGGAYGSSATRSNVDAYDASLTQHAVDSLKSARGHICAAAVGDYAIFSSGGDVYHRDLTKGTSVTGGTSSFYSASVELKNYAIFAGGGTIGSTYTDMVSAFDASLTRTAPTTLSVARIMLAGTNVGDYALFAGGSDNWGSSTSNTTVDAYDTSLTKRVSPALSVSRYGLAATTLGDYALFAGGGGSRTFYTVVDVYDAHLTRSLMDELSQPRRNMGAVTLGDYAIFAGGQKYNDNDKVSIVDAYTLI